MLRIYTIYYRPSDYPGAWVLRASTVTKEGVVTDQWPLAVLLAMGDDIRELETLRAEVPEGLTRMPRMPDDDPVIVESWL